LTGRAGWWEKRQLEVLIMFSRIPWLFVILCDSRNFAIISGYVANAGSNCPRTERLFFCQAQATKPAKLLLVLNNIHAFWKHALMLVGQGSLQLMHSVVAVDHQILVVMIVLDHCAAH